MTVHGLLQKSRLDAERLPYRILKFGNVFAVVHIVRIYKTQKGAEDFLVRKMRQD